MDCILPLPHTYAYQLDTPCMGLTVHVLCTKIVKSTTYDDQLGSTLQGLDLILEYNSNV